MVLHTVQSGAVLLAVLSFIYSVELYLHHKAGGVHRSGLLHQVGHGFVARSHIIALLSIRVTETVEEVLEHVECLAERDVYTHLSVLGLHEPEELVRLSEENVPQLIDIPQHPSEFVLLGGKRADLCVEAYAHKLVHHRRLRDVRDSEELVDKAHQLYNRMANEVEVLHAGGRERVEVRLYQTQAWVEDS